MASPRNSASERARFGILMMVLAMAGFAISDTFITLAGDSVTIAQSVFYVGVFCSSILGALVLIRNEPLWSRAYLSWPIALRAIGEAGVTYFLFMAFFTGSFTKTIAIHQFQPVLVTIGAVIFYRETVGWRKGGAILLALASVILILRPSLSGWDLAAGYAVIAVFCLALRDLATKSIDATLSAFQISFICILPLIPLGLAMLYGFDDPIRLPMRDLGLVFGAAATAVVAFLAITISMRAASFSTVMPFRYTRIPMAFLIGVLFFNETLDWQTIVGVIGILLAGLIIIMRTDRA